MVVQFECGTRILYVIDERGDRATSANWNYSADLPVDSKA